MFFRMQDKTTNCGCSGEIFILPTQEQWNITTEKIHQYFYQVQIQIFVTQLPWYMVPK